MLSMKQKKSHARSYDNSMDIWRSKKLQFEEESWGVLNQLNSASWAEKRSCEKSGELQGFLFD